jgi:hypothetical protein
VLTLDAAGAPWAAITVHPGALEADAWRHDHARRLHIRVRVSDRAGNVAAITRTATVVGG